jgi:hypothetical protein
LDFGLNCRVAFLEKGKSAYLPTLSEPHPVRPTPLSLLRRGEGGEVFAVTNHKFLPSAFLLPSTKKPHKSPNKTHRIADGIKA